jgi:octaprenyl-diphosphate synthase
MTSSLTISEQIRAPIAGELDRLEADLAGIFTSEVGLVSAIGRHLVSMKGKRIRPVLVLLAARIGDPEALEAGKVALAVEMIHTATLLHDDSIDRSHLRRGLPTVNRLWNDQVSVIMGDYLFCRAFRILHEAGLADVAAVLSAGSDEMTYGEMLQMDLRTRYDISEAAYLDMVKHKTAALFASACEAGAMIGGLGESDRTALKAYGEYLGTAFQVVDDILDFVGDAAMMGKPVGSDLKDGRITLPLIAALEGAGTDEVERVRRAAHDEVVGFIKARGGVEYAQRLAEGLADRAREKLAGLRPCPALHSLEMLTRYLVRRNK